MKKKLKKSKTLDPRNITWTTAQGETKRIKDIDDEHLINILRHLERRKRYDAYRFSLVVDCMFGDPNEMEAVEQAALIAKQSVPERYPIYAHLLAEAVRRKLIGGVR